MDETFRIYVEQLRDGHQEEIHEDVSPSFLDVHEPELAFEKNVLIEGVAYLAHTDLVLHLSLSTQVQIPCSICNQMISLDIEILDFYFCEPLSEIKSGIFSFEDLVREEILSEVPQFAECNQGSCLQRKNIRKYMKEPGTQQKEPDSEEGYRPFEHLEWDRQ